MTKSMGNYDCRGRKILPQQSNETLVMHTCIQKLEAGEFWGWEIYNPTWKQFNLKIRTFSDLWFRGFSFCFRIVPNLVVLLSLLLENTAGSHKALVCFWQRHH